MSIYPHLETNSGTMWEHTKFWSSVICGKNSEASISLTLQLVRKLQLPQSAGRNTASDWSVHLLLIGLLWPRMTAVCSVCLACGTELVHYGMPKFCKWDAEGVGVDVNYITALNSQMCTLPSIYRMVCNWHSIFILQNEFSVYNHQHQWTKHLNVTKYNS
jgi:hypothetical protein